MVDFAKMLADMVDRMTPDERADYERRQANEALLVANEREIVGHFERLERRPKPVPGSVLAMIGKRSGDYDVVVAEAWEKPVRLRLETRGEGDEERDVIRIMGAVTGHEAFRADAEFVERLLDPEERRQRPRFYVCAGTAGRYDACWIDIDDVVDYLREKRPALFGPAPAP